jgi:hypothetical protein
LHQDINKKAPIFGKIWKCGEINFAKLRLKTGFQHIFSPDGDSCDENKIIHVFFTPFF